MEILNINWSNAFTVMGLGLLIVFIVLVLLVFLLSGFSWFFREKEIPAVQAVAAAPAGNMKFTAAEGAAVAMALHLCYKDVHDEESYVITIHKDGTPYNPWSSKIYGLNNTI